MSGSPQVRLQPADLADQHAGTGNGIGVRTFTFAPPEDDAERTPNGLRKRNPAGPQDGEPGPGRRPAPPAARRASGAGQRRAGSGARPADRLPQRRATRQSAEPDDRP